ncbi:inactive leucine-rich repeat receptor-like protein kinase CORYNE isoform X1 [Typha latifolia]|uniref:inactive leucine-rich repeat receptor-like protein kinase CORYNE isoform X1 n=1 Tax=Typha latifolia TaxID=4733 RepID=UPI003C2ECE31
MEGRCKSHRKTLALQTLLILFFFLFQAPEVSYSQHLHSEPMFSQSPSSPSPSKIPKTSNSTHLRRILLGILFGSVTGFILALIFLFLIRLFVIYTHRTPILKGPVVFSPHISPKTLQLALAKEMQLAQLLGLSPNRKYYKVVLDNEVVVAVKRLEGNQANASPLHNFNSEKKRVQQQLEILALVKHRNVMSLRAYVHDGDSFSLVYDYIPTGSLGDVMKRVRSQQISIGWDVRNQIALGIVKGLRYLHFECNPTILHSNLKPSNVMLDEGFEPRLGDCGLTRLITANYLEDSSSAHYVAPECYQSSRYTDKSDIYSFGMILGVLLTGRDPSDPFFAGDAGKGSLARWLRHMQQSGEAKETLDNTIIANEGEEEEMLMAIRIALVCLSDLPADRPSSDELVIMLTQLNSL